LSTRSLAYNRFITACCLSQTPAKSAPLRRRDRTNVRSSKCRDRWKMHEPIAISSCTPGGFSAMWIAWSEFSRFIPRHIVSSRARKFGFLRINIIFYTWFWGRHKLSSPNRMEDIRKKFRDHYHVYYAFAYFFSRLIVISEYHAVLSLLGCTRHQYNVMQVDHKVHIRRCNFHRSPSRNDR